LIFSFVVDVAMRRSTPPQHIGLVELDISFDNDPSAGSPTETLLRLLLPLSSKICLTFRVGVEHRHSPKGSPDHSKSVGATGGVYKGQGLNQRRLMTCAY
jgi:hypothetical protein